MPWTSAACDRRYGLGCGSLNLESRVPHLVPEHETPTLSSKLVFFEPPGIHLHFTPLV